MEVEGELSMAMEELRLEPRQLPSSTLMSHETMAWQTKGPSRAQWRSSPYCTPYNTLPSATRNAPEALG